MIILLVLISITFSLFGFIIGIWADDFQKIQLIPSFVITPLTFLGGSFYSINMLPEFDGWSWGYLWTSSGQNTGAPNDNELAHILQSSYTNSAVNISNSYKSNSLPVRCISDDIDYGCTDTNAWNFNQYVDYVDNSILKIMLK